MFAFALWDASNKKLILARDPVGIKPLYYSILDGRIVFASEIKSILKFPGISKKIDYNALNTFFALRYIAGPRTIFANIRKLMPGIMLIYRKGRVTFEKYWEMDYKNGHDQYEGRVVEDLRKLLRDSVEKHLISDVPLGVYLSGGIDSSTVVAIMKEFTTNQIETFSVGFDIEKYSEAKDARVIAEYFDTSHHELLLSSDSIKILPRVVWHLDEPLGDPTAIPTFLLSKFARKYCKVILTGEGGDEVFAGYEHYKFMKIGSYIPKLPKGLVISLSNVARIIPSSIKDRLFRYSSSLGDKGIERFSYFLRNIDKPEESYSSLVEIFSDEERRELIKNEKFMKGKISMLFKPFFNSNLDILSKLQLVEMNYPLPDNLLMKVDKTTMANSIEARVPYLDTKILKFSSCIPKSLMLRGMKDKYILRKTMQGFLPELTVKKKKTRFFVPIDYWFGNELKDLVSRLKEDENLKDYIKKGYFSRLVKNFDRSKLYYARQLWNLLTFSLWYKIYVDNFDYNRPIWDFI